MIKLLLHKFYAASISFTPDGSMLIASTRERVLIWGTIFCFVAAASLIAYMLLRLPVMRKTAIAVLIVSLAIPIFIIPSVINESIQVSRDQITINSGHFYFPSSTIIALDDLQHLSRITNEDMISNVIGDAYVTWIFERQNGTVQTLVLNDYFSAHSMTIAHYIRDRGYRVEWLSIEN